VSEHHFSSVLAGHDTPGTVVDFWGPFLVLFSSIASPFLDFLLVKDPIFSNWLQLFLFSHLPNGPEVPLSNIRSKEIDKALEWNRSDVEFPVYC
jgi:hypothetical protein